MNATASYCVPLHEGRRFIGLYLCRRIVNLMGGTLTLDTQYAGGSRFVIAIG